MASVYDDINKIKREGSEYDQEMFDDYNPLDPSTYRMGSEQDFITIDTQRNAFYDFDLFRGTGYGLEGFGDSKYDRNYATPTNILDGRSLEDVRAERQPWYDQFANNLANLGTIALTVAVDTYAGTAAGLVNMIVNPEADPNLNWAERRLAAYVNNPISLTLNSIQKTIKENMPTYQTDQYRQNVEEGKWHKNFFTSGFWGEILENAGFTLGMAASGKLTGALLGRLTNVGKHINILEKQISNGIKSGQLTGTVQQNTMKALAGKLPTTGLDKGISEAVKNIKQASAINRNIATAVAVTGEARQEGINSSRDYHEQMTQRLNSMEGQKELAEKTLYDMFSKNPEMFQYSPLEGDPLQSIRPEYIEAFNQKLAENQAKAEEAIETASSRVASMNFALNFPILYGSSL